jgi:hypothetical protein
MHTKRAGLLSVPARVRFGVIAAALAILALSGIANLAAQQPASQQPAAAAGGRGNAPPPPPAKQPGHGTGKLVIWGDLASFQPRGHPMNCLTMNRFKRGEPVGFRMTAIDGGTGEVENTAELVAHVIYGGKTIDVPMRWRGAGGPNAPPPSGYLRPIVELWTGRWEVPADAPTSMLLYTVSAKDAFGRTTIFQPFSFSSSQLTIVE